MPAKPSSHSQVASNSTTKPKFKYRLIVSTGNISPFEDAEAYRPGGFCPVDIGDKILEAFEIVHKLGYSQHAFVAYQFAIQIGTLVYGTGTNNTCGVYFAAVQTHQLSLLPISFECIMG